MAFEAQFLHGSPVMVDHTPGVAVSAGQVVVTADTVRVAHLDIAANALGALAAEGGVYVMKGDAAIAADKQVFWDDTNNKVTETASGNKPFGVTVSACAADASYCWVRHDPGAATGREAVTAVAATGSVQGDAAALVEGFNHVTAADATKGVILPTAVKGMRVEVKNSDAANAILKVYPATGAAVNALSANAAISMAAKTSAVFVASSATQWYTIPLVPS